MVTAPTMTDRVRELVVEVLEVHVPDNRTDMMESGLIDSLALVTIIAEIEEMFQIELPLPDLDIAHFRSIESISHFLAKVIPPLA